MFGSVELVLTAHSTGSNTLLLHLVSDQQLAVHKIYSLYCLFSC